MSNLRKNISKILILFIFALALTGCMANAMNDSNNQSIETISVKILNVVKNDIENKKLTYDVIDNIDLYFKDDLLKQLPPKKELQSKEEKEIREKIENVLTLNAMYIKYTPEDMLKDKGLINTETPVGIDLYENIKDLAKLLEMKIE